MHDEPRITTFSTPARRLASIAFAAIIRLSYRNSACRSRFALIPPTRAAATMATSGRVRWAKASVGSWRRRSSSEEAAVIRFPIDSRWSRRTTAEPTMPRWPATHTRLPERSKGTVTLGCGLRQSPGLIECQPLQAEVVLDHAIDQLREAHLRFPPELGPGPGRVGAQLLHLERPEVSGIQLDVPLPVQADVSERQLAELPDRVGLPGADHVVPGLVPLHHQPDRVDEVAGVTPVSGRVQVAQVQPLLPAGHDPGNPPGDLPGDEGR